MSSPQYLNAASSLAAASASLSAVRMHLHAQHQAIVVMRTDCHVCRAEGLSARSQVMLQAGAKQILALLYQTDDSRLGPAQAGLSEAAWLALGIQEGDSITVHHPPMLESLAGIRRRIHGQRLDQADLDNIVRDVVQGKYSEVHLSAFLTATAALPLDETETIGLTQAMVNQGERLAWHAPIVVDKHCVGGLPGNRTTPIIVAIAAACGLMMPKTSSRAITSPAGTADTMATLAPVALDIATLQRVVETEGACLAWGGGMQISPADAIFSRIERELDIDTEGQLIASILSKKIAAGATHVVIDIPVGPTAKVRDQAAALRLGARLEATAAYFGMTLRCLYSDGTQPVGRGIGPALEAWDVLAVLKCSDRAPQDLRERALQVAAHVLELGGAAQPGNGLALARDTLDSGSAWLKFKRICDAQGGLREPPRAAYVEPLLSPCDGRLATIDNRKLARLAKLAGAPEQAAAGVHLAVRPGDTVAHRQPLLFLHAQTPGELAYATDYARAARDIFLFEA